MGLLNAGIVIPTPPDARQALSLIQEADAAGVATAWQTVGGTRPDAVTLYGAAAVTTSSIRLGTSIVPTYPRHPAALASQVLTLEALAPGRIRLGLGPSHRPTIEGSFGIPMGKPLAHLREYVAVIREILWNGSVDFRGEYFAVQLALQDGTTPPRTELPISALSAGSYRLAGEIADAAISWVSPVPYLVETALPAIAEGATIGKRPAPPLIAHIPVAVTTDRNAALEATMRQFAMYGSLPFYARMFTSAGVPPENDKTSPAAIDALLVSGSPDKVRSRLAAIQAEGIGELLVSHIGVHDEAVERRELHAILAS